MKARSCLQVWPQREQAPASYGDGGTVHGPPDRVKKRCLAGGLSCRWWSGRSPPGRGPPRAGCAGSSGVGGRGRPRPTGAIPRVGPRPRPVLVALGTLGAPLGGVGGLSGGGGGGASGRPSMARYFGVWFIGPVWFGVSPGPVGATGLGVGCLKHGWGDTSNGGCRSERWLSIWGLNPCPLGRGRGSPGVFG